MNELGKLPTLRIPVPKPAVFIAAANIKAKLKDRLTSGFNKKIAKMRVVDNVGIGKGTKVVKRKIRLVPLLKAGELFELLAFGGTTVCDKEKGADHKDAVDVGGQEIPYFGAAITTFDEVLIFPVRKDFMLIGKSGENEGGDGARKGAVGALGDAVDGVLLNVDVGGLVFVGGFDVEAAEEDFGGFEVGFVVFMADFTHLIHKAALIVEGNVSNVDREGADGNELPFAGVAGGGIVGGVVGEGIEAAFGEVAEGVAGAVDDINDLFVVFLVVSEGDVAKLGEEFFAFEGDLVGEEDAFEGEEDLVVIEEGNFFVIIGEKLEGVAFELLVDMVVEDFDEAFGDLGVFCHADGAGGAAVVVDHVADKFGDSVERGGVAHQGAIIAQFLHKGLAVLSGEDFLLLGAVDFLFSHCDCCLRKDTDSF